MPSVVEYFISERSKDMKSWDTVYKWVTENGYTLHTKPVECDLSVVLNGKFVNPLPLYGKKVLLYRRKDWSPLKWDSMFRFVLEEYYDDMVDITSEELFTTVSLEKVIKNLESKHCNTM